MVVENKAAQSAMIECSFFMVCSVSVFGLCGGTAPFGAVAQEILRGSARGKPGLGLLRKGMAAQIQILLLHLILELIRK
jgi:hypothetical protein